MRNVEETAPVRALLAPLAAAALAACCAWLGAPAGQAAADDNATSSELVVKVDGGEAPTPNANITFSVPSKIAFTAKSNGELTATSVGSIENKSVFAIHVSSMQATAATGWTIVADAAEATSDNAVSLKIGPKDVQLPISDYTTKTDVGTPSKWGMGPAGASDGSRLLALTTSDGKVNNVTADLSTDQPFATIQWYVKAGLATA